MGNSTSISKLSLFNYFNHRFVSKWLVLLIDLCLISISLLISFFLLPEEQLQQLTVLTFYKRALSVLCFAVIGHYIFKPHLGLIRHTTLHDVKRVFYARTLAMILNIFFIVYISKELDLRSFAIPIRVSLVNYVMSLYLLIQFRLGVKYIFNMGSRQKNKQNIVIYGAGVEGHLVFDTLSTTLNVVAFLDDNFSKKGKFYKDTPIYLFNEGFKKLVEKNNIQKVIIAIQNITPVKKRQIVDACIKFGVEVQVVPPVSQWVNGEFKVSQLKEVKIDDLLGREVISLENRLLQYKLHDKTIMVTGSAGSIGAEIARQLLHYNPKQLILIDQAETPLYNLELELNELNIKNVELKLILADIKDEKRMKEIFDSYKINWIFHAAAYKHVPTMEMNPKEALKVNLLGTKNIADLANFYKVEKMVFVSTDKAVNPTNIMGATKRAAEMYIQSKNDNSYTSYITTRFGNVLGSNGSVIPVFEKQIKKGGPIKVTHPDITRYFMTIPEACQLVLEAGVMGEGGEIFVFDMGDSVKIIDLAEKMIQLSGLIPYKDINIEFTGLRPGEKLFEELLNNKESIIPTHHEKIMKAKVATNNYLYVEQAINKINELVLVHSSDNILVAELKKLVPEYISQNSFYEKLDKENKATDTNSNIITLKQHN